MKNLMRTCSTALLAVAFGAPSAFAQEREGFDVQFKARAGYGLKAADNLTRRAIGFGLELGYNTSIGRFGAEVGYQYKPGDRYLYDVSKAPMIPGTVFVPGLTLQQASNSAASGDVRRQDFSGMMFRLSYECDLNDAALLRAGVQLFGARYRQEVQGAIIYRNPEDPTKDDATYTGRYVTDVYAGRHEVSSLSPSPFVGLGFKVGSNVTFEANLIGLSYTTIDYVHVAGTGSVRAGLETVHSPGNNISRDYTVEKSTMVPHIEFAIAFRF